MARYLPPHAQDAKETNLMGTTNYNSAALDKLPPDSSHQIVDADLDDNAKNAVPVGTSIFGPFNKLTSSNLRILHRQQISKGIREELAKVRDLRAYLGNLQISNLDFAPRRKYSVVSAACGLNENVCEQRHLIMETPAYSVATQNITASRVPNGGLITPQSLDDRAKLDPFVSIPAQDVMRKPSKPSPTLSGPTVIDSTTSLVPVATRKEEKRVLSWPSSIPEDNVVSSANTVGSISDPPAPKSTCSEVHSDVHSIASVAYYHCKNRLENVRDWIKKGRAARKAERAAQRGQRSFRGLSRINYQGFLLGNSAVNTTVNEDGDGRITKLLADLEENYVARVSALEAKCVARISAVEQACEFRVGELNAAFGARLADLEEEWEMVANKLANAIKNISILANEIESFTDYEAILGVRQNQQLKLECKGNAASTYQRHGMDLGQGEAFRI
ncbi:hypothetical protein L211DRAFT_894008 [Terfezia boudieri ATCC MYA-4762]|uniref:Uncharacterized protein n=1 Tax=Terfezia boudieri ATCC MYA-4762 TaxID=1051890 RepID=A0A3N4M2Z5_9PEZI|nr:hypothetical protein L211DRAFT_894008 [Terfezia boudieri ATCC MYA-4762]